ncbi:unnamed protein product [Prunus brigantina]
MEIMLLMLLILSCPAVVMYLWFKFMKSQNLLIPPNLEDANLKLLHQVLPKKPPLCPWKGWRPMCLGTKMLPVPLCPRKKPRLQWKDASFESARVDLEALASTHEQVKKADVEVGLEVWSGKMKRIRTEKLLVDTLHYAFKIETLLSFAFVNFQLL